MKAAVYYKNSDIRVEEIEDIAVDIPVNAKEIKIKVKSCGVCGSDVMEWYRIKRAGRPGGIGAFGHECTGVIEEVGEEVDPKWQIGARVVFTHHVSCNQCSFCLRGHTTVCKTFHNTKFKNKYGAFAEYVVLPEINVDRGLFKLAENITFDEGTFVEPLGCVSRGQWWAQVGEEKTVFIIGAGISGILHLQLAKINGAGFVVVSDIIKERLERATRLGADSVIDANSNDIPTRLMELNGGKGADVVILTVPISKCVQQAIQSVAPGGTILFFTSTKPDISTSLYIWNLWQNEITITHSYGADTKDLTRALKLIESGKINIGDMITHVLPLEETSKGFKLTAKPKDGSLKVIIHPED